MRPAEEDELGPVWHQGGRRSREVPHLQQILMTSGGVFQISRKGHWDPYRYILDAQQCFLCTRRWLWLHDGKKQNGWIEHLGLVGFRLRMISESGIPQP